MEGLLQEKEMTIRLGGNDAVGLHVMKFIWLVEDHLALMECELLILGGD